MDKKAPNSKPRIWLSSPHMCGLELDFINDAFKTNWIAPLGPNVDGFEKDIEDYLGNKSKVAALTTGTAAIHLALVLLGIGKDDEVICQTKTFIASVNPVIYLGATPVLVDSELETWNMCPKLMERAIQDRIALGKKPKAIIVINLYGMPYQTVNIHRVARQYEIPVIEDSAEALGSSQNGKKCGTFGDISVLSFNGNKIITTSGGGALICKDSTIKNKAIFLATQAKELGLEYNHKTIGYNYRMSNVIAGIGRGQMQVLDERVEKRREIFNYYYKELANYKDIEFLEEPKGSVSNRWLTCIKLSSKKLRDGLLKALNDDNIEARPSWKPMHLQPILNEYPKYLNGIAKDLYYRVLCLPSGSNLNEEDLLRVVKRIKEYIG